MWFPIFKIKNAIVAVSQIPQEDQVDTFTFNFPFQSLALWCVLIDWDRNHEYVD
jgi:hypothetical protein